MCQLWLLPWCWLAMGLHSRQAALHGLKADVHSKGLLLRIGGRPDLCFGFHAGISQPGLPSLPHGCVVGLSSGLPMSFWHPLGCALMQLSHHEQHRQQLHLCEFPLLNFFFRGWVGCFVVHCTGLFFLFCPSIASVMDELKHQRECVQPCLHFLPLPPEATERCLMLCDGCTAHHCLCITVNLFICTCQLICLDLSVVASALQLIPVGQQSEWTS